MSSEVQCRPLVLHASIANRRRLRAAGSRYEIGYQQGVADRAAIRRFLEDREARLSAILGIAGGRTSFAPEIMKYEKVIQAHLPGMAEELHGLAEGAGIMIEDAYLLQLRRELVGYRSVKVLGDCTTFGRRTPGNTVLGQTIDLNGDMERELTIMELAHRDTGRQLMLVSFTGLLGYLGMNDRGVSICLNLVLGGAWKPGIPGYMAIRHLLDEASSVEHCIDLLRALPLASSRSMTITDGRRLVTVEYILDEIAILEGDELAHANHFLHPDFAGRDELNPFARTSSLRRLDACVAGLRNLPAGSTAEAYFGMLESPPIHVAPNGDIRRECTVGAVVMFPDTRTMFVRQPDCGAPTIH